MELVIDRKYKTDKSTISNLTINGKFFCFVLEDVIRTGKKIYGKTAIPSGRYRIIISFSPRFQQFMPLLLNVAWYEGIRIHWGNVAEHTEGCLLVGYSRKKDFIGDSKKAYSDLMKTLNAANKKEAIWITIK